LNNISWDKFGGIDFGDGAISENIGVVGRVLFQGLLYDKTIRRSVHNSSTEQLTSMAFSALDSWITPTAALAIKMSKMTAGSTNTVNNPPPSELSSKRANIKEMAAEASKMRTSLSLNCSRISSHRGVAGSSGSSIKVRK
jgi:hypothetical protein